MPAELVEIGASVGVGIIDNILVELEERGRITGKLTYVKDGLRMAEAFAGLAVNVFVARPGTMLDKVSGSIALSSLPLAIHSIRNLVKGALRSSPSYGGGGYVLEETGRPVQQVGQPITVTSY
jgi:hypothetical protein